MIQVYTGNGKGKTTAAIGLAIRSLGAGHKVYLMQFMKSLSYSEQGLLRTFPHMTLETTGKPFFIAEDGMMDEKTKEAFGDSVVIFPKGHPPADYVALTGEYQLVILDEINVALAFGVLQKEQMEHFLEILPPETELVCTGRNAPQWLLDRADLITEMKEVRHYYERGIPARKGIEN